MRVPNIIRFIAIIIILIATAPSARAQYVYNRADFPIATGPGIDVATADFNGDGILDLAVVMGGVEGAQGKVSILLGKPDGTFGPHTDFTLGVYSTQVVVGDFNADGKLDLAVLNIGLGQGYPGATSTVSVLLGNGDGTFQAPLTTSFGATVTGNYGMAAGDFNGDGKLDLVAVIMGGAIEVLPGNGDGTFGPPITTEVVTNYTYQLYYLAVGDFNGDGKLDVAVPLYPGSLSPPPSVDVLLGNGNGTFQAPVSYPMQANEYLVAVDVNHDGILDLLGGGDGISVLLGKGDGTFQPEIDSASGATGNLVVGDFNGDGNLDAAGSNGSQLYSYLGDGTGNFRLLGAHAALPSNPGNLAVGDFNGDGIFDLAIPGQSEVSVLLGNGNGTMGPTYQVGIIYEPLSAAVADFNGDGKLDLAIGEAYQAAGLLDIQLGNGEGALNAVTPVNLPMSCNPVATVTGDFNGDGKPDLAVLLSYPCNSIEVFQGKGDGTFTLAPPKLSAEFGDYVLLAADFNNDGKLDLLVAGGTPPARLFLGNGNGTFQAPVGVINWPPGENGQVIAADFNHDGKMDVAGTVGNQNELLIYLGNGDGTFQSPRTFTTDFSPAGLVAADFNGDGNLDIAVATGEGVDVFLGNGNGTFQSPTEYNPPSDITLILAGDFNGDGKIDLATAAGQNSNINLLLGHGDGTFSAPLNFGIPASLLVSGDFNGDGTVDLGSGYPGGYYVGTYFSVWSSAPFVALGLRGLNLGGVPVGISSEPQTVTVWNIGTAPMQIAGVAAGGDFFQTNDCGSVAAGASCAINVTFTPAATGPSNGMLTITDNSRNVAGSTQTVPLTGTGTLPLAGPLPRSLTFGNQMVGTTSASQPVTLSNVGTGSLTISDITTTGDFGQINTCGGSVAANGPCAIYVTFTPTATGTRTGTLTITDDNNGVEGSTQTINLTGTGTAPVVGSLPASLTFGNQNLGTTSASQPVTLNNTGTGALTIAGIAITGDFSQTSTCGGSLAANGSCTINVTFTPTATGTRNGTLTITDNNNGVAGSTQTVSPMGTGMAPVAGPLPPSLTFGNQCLGTASASQPVTLSNTGNAALTIAGIATTGDFGQTNTCGGSVAASGSCTINVTFAPATTGTRNGTLTITDNNDDAAGSTQTLSLTGTGTAPVAGPLPPSLMFGNQNLNTPSASQQVTLSNSGTATLTITGIATTGDFGQTNICGGSVAANGSCTINMTFTPTATGTRSGALTITDNNNGVAGSTQTVNLMGTGTTPVVSMSTASLGFGNQAMSATTIALPATVTNTGTGGLTISAVTLGGANAADFAKSADTCTGATVSPGNTCAVSVTFTPCAAGSRGASLNFTDNASNSPQAVTLSGTGVEIVVHWPGPIVLPPRPPWLPVPGRPPLPPIVPQPPPVGGTGADPFVITPDATVLSLPPASLSVQEQPTHNSSNGPPTGDLGRKGNGILVSLSAPVLSFGSQVLSTTSAAQQETVTTTGTESLTISAVTVDGMNARDFAKSADTCTGATITAGSTCTVSVTFTPSAMGSRRVSLNFRDNASNSPQSVTLRGNGIEPVVHSPSPTLVPPRAP